MAKAVGTPQNSYCFLAKVNAPLLTLRSACEANEEVQLPQRRHRLVRSPLDFDSAKLSSASGCSMRAGRPAAVHYRVSGGDRQSCCQLPIYGAVRLLTALNCGTEAQAHTVPDGAPHHPTLLPLDLIPEKLGTTVPVHNINPHRQVGLLEGFRKASHGSVVQRAAPHHREI